MDGQTAGQLAADLDSVKRALDGAHQMLVSIDVLRASVALEHEVTYSPLRTVLEQAQIGLERVQTELRNAARPRGRGRP